MKRKVMKQGPMLLLLYVVGCMSWWPIEAASQESPIDAYATYNIKEMLSIARQLQNLGEKKAIAKLMSWAKADPENLRTIVMCRMLFKGKSALRRPYLGAGFFLGGTSYEDWPLEPVAIFEGIPILITRGYLVDGLPESAQAYLSLCVKEGSWVSKKYEARTTKQIKASLNRFLRSAKWKKELSELEKRFLISQLK